MVGLHQSQRIARKFNERILKTRRRTQKRSARDTCVTDALQRACRAAVWHSGNAPDSIKFRQRFSSTDRIRGYPYTFHMAFRRGIHRTWNCQVGLFFLFELAEESDSND